MVFLLFYEWHSVIRRIRKQHPHWSFLLFENSFCFLRERRSYQSQRVSMYVCLLYLSQSVDVVNCTYIHCFPFSKYIVSCISVQHSTVANRNGQQRIANTQEDNRYLLNVWQRKEKGNVKTKFGQHVIFPVQIDGNNMVKFDSCFWWLLVADTV